MIAKLNFTFLNADNFGAPSAKSLGMLACGSAALALWHRVDCRNDLEENKIRNSTVQTTFLSLSSMFGMLWALSESNVHGLTKLVATLGVGAATTIPVVIMAARTFPTYQEITESSYNKSSSPTSTESIAFPKSPADVDQQGMSSVKT